MDGETAECARNGVEAMKMRQAAPSDAAALRDLINAAFRVERFFVDGDRISLEDVDERLRDGEFLVLEDGGTLAGCVYVQYHGKRAYLGLLSIDPSRQGRGLGSRLVGGAEQQARRAGCGAIDLLIVNLRQELPGFYRRLGYIETGTEPFPENEPTKLPCHFIRMSKDLG